MRATCRTFFWLYNREKMIPWLALGLSKAVHTTHVRTHSKKNHIFTTTCNIFIAFYWARPAKAWSQLSPSVRVLLFPSSLAHSFEMKVQLSVFSLPADRWSSGSDQKDVGLLSNAVLMVPCVAGRERQAATNRNSSDSPEPYIMASFCWGGPVKPD